VLIGHSLGGSVALHAAPLLGSQLAAMVQIGSGGGVYQPRPFARLRRGGALLLQLRPSWLGPWAAESPWRGPLMAETRAARGLLATSTRREAVRQLPMSMYRQCIVILRLAGRPNTAREVVRLAQGVFPNNRYLITTRDELDGELAATRAAAEAARPQKQLAADFADALEQSALDPATPEYHQLWNRERAAADARFRAMYGGHAWMAHHVQSHHLQMSRQEP
jgi:pimeloyl-ACP methyl ester carboxylesterase